MGIREKSGFALVELIIVIAILAILAALLIPFMIGYLDTAQRNVCVANVDTAQRSALHWFALKEGYRETDAEKSALLDQVMKDSFSGRAVKAGENRYGGLCPSSGEYVFAYTEEGLPSCSCTEHQTGSGSDLDAIKKLWGIPKVHDYFVGKGNKSSLDSTGKNHAPEVNEALRALGIDPDSASWRIYKAGNDDFIIYWTNTNIANATPGDTLPVTRYYTKTGLSQSGTAPVAQKTVEGQTFHVIDAANFVVE